MPGPRPDSKATAEKAQLERRQILRLRPYRQKEPASDQHVACDEARIYLLLLLLWQSA